MTCSKNCPNCNDPDPPSQGPLILPDWKKVFVSRMEFMKLVSLVSSVLIGILAAIPGIGFAFNYFLTPEKREWVAVGPATDYKEGDTVAVFFKDPYRMPWDGVTSNRTAWLRREGGDKFTAFALNCTHLGCPVRWEKGAELFMCPCHGGVFYSDGTVAGGPPPRPLHQYPVRINQGNVELYVGPVLTEQA